VNDLLALDFMRQALLAALLAGFAAPLVGVFLVQRRMSLIGDGMGHVALAGVAVGVLTNQAPVLTALVAAVLAAVAIELIRASGRTSGDTALAVMFYGGIALGVVLIARSSAGTPATLTSYLFGAILTTTTSDIIVFAVLAAVVLATTLVLRPRFFAVANDEEYARALGMPVLGYNVVLAVLTAVTVVVSMRIVGLLLISALMILPNATSQLFARSFRSALWWAVGIGVACSVGGVVVSYYAETPSGGTCIMDKAPSKSCSLVGAIGVQYGVRSSGCAYDGCLPRRFRLVGWISTPCRSRKTPIQFPHLSRGYSDWSSSAACAINWEETARSFLKKFSRPHAGLLEIVPR